MRTLAFMGALGMMIQQGFVSGPEHPSYYILLLGVMTGALGWGRGEKILDRLRNDDESDAR